MKYEIIELEDTIVCGLGFELSKSFSNNIGLCQGYWKQFNMKLKEYSLHQGRHWCKYAIIERINGKEYYFICIPKEEYAINNFIPKNIHKGKYMRAEHTGPMTQLNNTIRYLYKVLIPGENIQLRNEELVYFEKYNDRFHWNRLDSVIEIYIPIK